jgi:hypothetical protein
MKPSVVSLPIWQIIQTHDKDIISTRIDDLDRKGTKQWPSNGWPNISSPLMISLADGVIYVIDIETLLVVEQRGKTNIHDHIDWDIQILHNVV